MNNTILYIIIPCYNESAVLPETHLLFLDELKFLIQKEKISNESRILFMDNASTDNTWKLIQSFAKEDIHFIGAKQSRNFGHQGNVLGGLMEAKDKCDITISIDCDGQDSITAIEDMVDAYHNGSEVVYGVRSSRKKDSFLKRFTAQSFYKLLNKMGANVVYNHADYRLISNRVLREFSNFKEVNLFLRGLVPLVGFKSSSVYYERNERIAGKSHYPISSLLTLAFDGITSLSTKPIKIITSFGLLFSFVSLLGIIWTIVSKLCHIGESISGYASLVCIICFFGGIQLIALGVIGEYIGKIYMETKARPRYIIAERTWECNDNVEDNNE